MDPAAPGRFDILQTSFKAASKCLLTACSREAVKRAFPSFTDAERERLYHMLTRVMKAMHATIEEEFDEVCQERQVAAALDKIDDFDEEQNLDVLPSEKTSIEEIEEKISRAKKDEIEHLAALLKKVEESNNAMKARLELLKKGEDSTASRDVLNKLTQLNSTYACEQ
ncbi:hypothetical protein SETIT_6G051200v2 [Setaria italica]|uniref:Uncharacterized protein n=1 Tax=Setaria italica TaxID=4555 RepID=K3YJY1_SETIT|nr:uncharacterized protein LOC101785418 [Setaria italica]RCV29908.1 hypothetical protein SETIT_6G051200v2 [Setaria italica]